MIARTILGLTIALSLLFAACNSDSGGGKTATSGPGSTATVTKAPATKAVKATSTPKPDAGETAYRARIQAETTALGTSMDKVQQLTQNATLDDNWKTQMAVQLALWKRTYTEAKGLTPPAKYQAFHTAYVAALAQLDQAADDYADGIDHVDAATINKGTGEVQTANALIATAQKLLPAS